ncbi:GDSL-LIKE LIPASE/ACYLHYDROLASE [Salix purpurea]|uniref:GDSL-LIKE LIPASE/ACYLHYDROLASE n=1 Tax=Salix purpurea TaxID=77065 RepID=A0A9Q0VTA0_SALPP|nr:GDSL-LIKE LIPASE/ACYLHYDROLASE [Salix purpurea]
MTYFKHPTGRISDGRLIPDFIAEFAKLPLIPLYLQPGDHKLTYGVNFASGGAGALAGTNQGLVCAPSSKIFGLDFAHCDFI